MRMRRGLVLAISLLVLAAVGVIPDAARASTKCQCNNGAIVESMDEDEDACDDACEGMEGGRPWTPQDADSGDDEGDEVDVRQPRVEEPRVDRER